MLSIARRRIFVRLAKAIALGSHGPSLSPSEIADLAYSSKFFSDPQLIPIFLLSVGVKVPETSEFELQA
jgi:hypothetical protein